MMVVFVLLSQRFICFSFIFLGAQYPAAASFAQVDYWFCLTCFSSSSEM